jgi:hypothetical protein
MTDETAHRLDRLETRLAEQHERIERQAATIAEQEETIRELREQLDDEDDGDVIMDRRTALQAGGVLGLLGVGASAASADPQGSIGTSSDPLQQVHTEELNGGVTGETALTNLAGPNLSIDGSGNLNASGASKWADSDTNSLLEPSGSETGIDVADVRTDTLAADDASQVTVNSDLDFGGNNVTLTEDFELDMQPGLDSVAFRDTNNGHDIFRATTGAPGKVDLLNADIQVRNGNGIVDGSGDHFLTINSGGPLGVDKTLDLTGNDLEDAGTTIWDGTSNQVPTARLAADSVTVAGNAVSLGGSTSVAHADLNSVGSDDHHAQDHASRHAQGGADAVNVEDLATSTGSAGKVATSDGSGGLTLDDAVTGQKSSYEIQKNGSDGAGVINFKT